MKRLALAAVALLSAASAHAEPRVVDLELVMLVDASASINATDLRIQLDGYAAGFDDPAVVRAITDGPIGRIAVTLARFDGPRTLRVLIPWTLVDGADSAAVMALAIRTVDPGTGGSSTAVSDALMRSIPLFEGNGFEGLRLVIDLSGDGPDSPPIGGGMVAVRQMAIAAGVTISALAITTEHRDLREYMRDNVIVGPGAFALAVDDLADYQRGMRDKLITEISWLPDSRPVLAAQQDERSPSS